MISKIYVTWLALTKPSFGKHVARLSPLTCCTKNIKRFRCSAKENTGPMWGTYRWYWGKEEEKSCCGTEKRRCHAALEPTGALALMKNEEPLRTVGYLSEQGPPCNVWWGLRMSTTHSLCQDTTMTQTHICCHFPDLIGRIWKLSTEQDNVCWQRIFLHYTLKYYFKQGE